MGLSSTLDEGTPKSQPLPEGTTTNPKDSRGNIQPTNKGLPSTDSKDGVVKTTTFTKGPRGDKDSEGLKPPADMEPLNPSVADLSRADAQESSSDSSCPEALKKYDNILPLTERQLVKYLQKLSQAIYGRLSTDFWDKHEEAVVSYADLGASIEGTEKADLLKVLNRVTDTLKAIQEVVKEDPSLTKKLLEATEVYTETSKNITELISLTKAFNFFGLKSLIKALQAVVDAQNEHLTALQSDISSLKTDTSDIKSIMIEIYQEFKGPSSTPSSSVLTTTLTLTEGPATLTNDEILAHMEKDELIKKAAKEARLLTITKPEVIKIVREDAEKIGLDTKRLASAQVGEKFKKAHDDELKVLNKGRNEQLRRSLNLKNKKYEYYIWAIGNRLKQEKITNVKIHPNTKPVLVTVYRSTDRRTFEVPKPFSFATFGITELDELGEIIP
ncbi:hypothetical protein Tco_0155861 [Tanacetum coccineum]